MTDTSRIGLDPAGSLSEAPSEECGVFGIFGPGEDVARLTYFGLFALQHRGQESAGIAVSDGETIRLHKDMGLVSQVFTEDDLQGLRGHLAVGHTRYSTTGGSVARNAQPLCCTSVVGEVAVAHNGNLINTDDLSRRMRGAGRTLTTSGDSELIAQMIADRWCGSIEDAVAETMPELRGAYALVIMTRDKLVAVRDPHGIRPLCVGRLNGSGYVVASETCALNVVGAELVREIEPGEMVSIDGDGISERQAVPLARHAMCLFEFIYFARPDSQIYGRVLHDARRRMGHELAREHPSPGAHLVVPIPDSAIPAALGYAQASGIPFTEGVVKNRYIQRTFIQPDQRMRDLGVRMKFTPLRGTLAGHKVVMVDDSIVRGTTTGKLVKMLRDAGADEVHVRISAPPVRFPCYYGIDMAKQKELVAATKSEDEIRDMIGATSLGYLSLDGCVRAVGMRKGSFCRACFDGQYPLPVPRDVKLSKLMLEPQPEPAPEATEAIPTGSNPEADTDY